MAKKKTAKKEVAAAAPVKEKKSKLTAEEKAAKTAARKARLEAIPEGQRTNSRSIDVILSEDGKSKVVVYAQPIRKFGVLITPVAYDAKGNIISVGGSTTLEGYKAKAKKGHGNLALGTPGVGKKGKSEVEDEDEDDSNDED